MGGDGQARSTHIPFAPLSKGGMPDSIWVGRISLCFLTMFFRTKSASAIHGR